MVGWSGHFFPLRTHLFVASCELDEKKAPNPTRFFFFHFMEAGNKNLKSPPQPEVAHR
jgi:hypothetical protein